jgi:hypothetical protein
MAKQLTKNRPCQFGRFGVQFSPIREYKRWFQAISRAIRDNWRYFETKPFVAKFFPLIYFSVFFYEARPVNIKIRLIASSFYPSFHDCF